jgi:hypothetical protein
VSHDLSLLRNAPYSERKGPNTPLRYKERLLYLTINYLELSRHISKEHLNGLQASRSRIDDLYDDVYLQTWTHGGSWKYWIVQKDGSWTRHVTGQQTRGHLLSVWEREHKRLETEDQPRVYSTDTGVHTLVATRPWMDRTRWPITYRNVRRDVLLALADMPNLRCRRSDHYLGQGPGGILFQYCFYFSAVL